MRTRRRISAEVRFWSKVDIRGEDECWDWKTGTMSSGYGSFDLNKKSVLAHRMAYMLSKGEIPDGLFVCHHCDNPKCCNPSHLFVGTPADNLADMFRKGRGQKRLPPGERRPGKKRLGEMNGLSKITMEQAREIRQLAADGVPRKEIMRIYSLGYTAVRYIILGKTWKEES